MKNPPLTYRDHAPSAVLKRVVMNLPEEADNLLKGRVRVIKSVFLVIWSPALTSLVFGGP